MNEALKNGVNNESKAAFEEWLKVKDNSEASRVASEKVIEACKREKCRCG